MLSKLALTACVSQGHIYQGVRMKAAALEQAHAQCPILLESQVFSSNEENGTAFNVGFSMYNYCGCFRELSGSPTQQVFPCFSLLRSTWAFVSDIEAFCLRFSFISVFLTCVRKAYWYDLAHFPT